LGDALETHFEKPLEGVWSEAAKGVDAVKGAASRVEHAASSAYHSTVQNVSAAASSVGHRAASAVSEVEARVSAASSATVHKVGSAANSVVSGAKNAAFSAWKTVSGWL